MESNGWIKPEGWQTFPIRVGNDIYDVDAPDAATAQQWAMSTHTTPPDKPEESETFKAGREFPAWAQGGLKLGDVMSFGLAKKMAGGPYTEATRGAVAEFGEKHPAMSFGAEILGTLPQTIGAAETLPGRVVSIPQQVGRTAAASTVQGGLSGIGSSQATTPEDVLADAAKTAALGTGMGVGGLLTGKATASMVGPVARRAGAAVGANQFGNVTPAQRRLALELSRSTPEGWAGTPAQWASQELLRLGPEGRLADLGEGPRRLSDLLASMPGRAKATFENLIEGRQAGRAGRIIEGVESATGIRQSGLAALDELAARKASEAGPLYDQIRGISVPLDNDLVSILRRAGAESIRKANQIARLEGRDNSELRDAVSTVQEAIDRANSGNLSASFDDLDRVKRALWDLGEQSRRTGSKETGRAFDNVRRDLIAKLDRISPKDRAGESIYRQARETFGGIAELESAVNDASQIFNMTSMERERMLRDMSPAQRDALRIGAVEAVREKVSTEPGQTSLLKWWKESKTSAPLRDIFNNDFQAFKRALEAESTLKKLEGVGRGSKSFSMFAAEDDLASDAVMNGVEAAAKGGVSPWSLVGTARSLRNKATMPEGVRDQLARMLATGGTPAQAELDLLDRVMTDVARSRARSSRLAGALGARGSEKTRNSGAK